MNTLDIIIIAVMGFFATISFFRGFVREAFTLGGLILGIILANIFYSFPGKVLVGLADFLTPAMANVMGYLLIFISVTVVMYFTGRLLNEFVELVLLKWLDRLLGFVFGLAKGFIIVAVLAMVLGLVAPRESRFINKSVLLPRIESAYAFLPEDMLLAAKEKKREFENYLNTTEIQEEKDK
ncbi:MAG: CvpA family protein [Bacteroidota bacterium]